MKWLYLTISLLIVCSCASTPQTRQIRQEIQHSLPLAVELTDVPFYPQTKYQCGPAALATVLQAQHIDTSPDKLSKQVYLPGKQGSLQIEMAVAARRHEALPYPLEPALKAIFTEIAAGNPVLVLQNLGLDWFPQWHYAVAVGYDINNNEIILRSGTRKRRVTPLEVFERSWQRADYWALVIVPLQKIPDTAKPLTYLKTAYAFEETARSGAALRAYQAASKHWPGETPVWIALGNIALQLDDTSLAVNAFHKAAELAPQSVTAWNNLAYALHFQGCLQQSRQALQCAFKIAPDDKNLADSKNDLENTPVIRKSTACPVIDCSRPADKKS